MIDKNKLMGHIVSNGYSQRSLAKKLGCSVNTLNSKINNKTPIDTEMIDKICTELHITDGAKKAEIFLS